MAATWQNIFVAVPTDAQVVWIVRLPFFDTPVQATWNEAASQFTWTDSATNDHTIAVNAVFKWRDL